MKTPFALCRWFAVVLVCLFVCTANAATPSLSTTFDDNGLATLRYGDLTLTDTAEHGDDAFSLYDIDGAPVEKLWDAPSRTLIYKYGWGNVACQYTQRGEQLDLDISIANNSTHEVGGFNMFPLGLRFQDFPKGYDAFTPHVRFNSDGPSVQSADFGSGIVTIINRDVQNRLCVGLISSHDTAQSFNYKVYVGSTKLWYQPGNWPTFNRPIAAGGSDNYQISLRFSPPGSDENSIADDISAQYAAAHPMELTWNDRRPIAALFLSSAADNQPQQNPRGWFYNDESIDVHSAPGREILRQRVLDFADESIKQMKSVGAQGMITWDIEGQEYPHATSYIGDPTLTAQLAPEMEGIADAYFARFAQAGMRIGICVRPQQLVVAPDGSAEQTEVADVAAQLNAKIQYAMTRWGATMFYVDSNGGPYDPTDAAIFAQVARAHPDVLLIPEHQNPAYYAYTAPFNQLNEADNFTSAEVRRLYPNAFSVVKLAGDDYVTLRAAMVEAVKRGDILMFNGWYDSPDGQVVRDIYAQLGQSLQVTTLADVVDPDDGKTSLREAMTLANAAAGGAEITFAPDVRGKLRLSGQSLPELSGNCTIVGPGARIVTIDGTDRSGLFQVASGARLTLSGLTLRGGNAGGDSDYNGGAICSEGVLAVRDCYFTNNVSNVGGAIFSSGTGASVVENCTFDRNNARNVGGAIFSENNTLSLTQCTLSNNAAPSQSAGGGAICANTVQLTLESCTLSGNSAGISGGGIWFLGGVLTLHNSILAGNGAFDVQMDGGYLSSNGYNLIGAATATWDWAWKASDKRGIDANLDSMKLKGGSTPVCMPLVGSVAINAGDPAIKSGKDQRGYARVSRGRADIGAVETTFAAPVAAIVAPMGGSGGSS